MANVLKLIGARKELNGKSLFTNVGFDLIVGETVVLFGRNGVGKTTLLSCLMGRIDLDDGTLQRFVPIEAWGWLEQELELPSRVTLMEFVRTGGRTTPDRGVDNRLTDPSNIAVDRYQAETALRRLGLQEFVWDTTYAELSGGQKTRAQLARLMIQRPSVLLLDEPTNHLDENTLVWLEDWINSYKGTVLMVTHDRTLMDHVADAVIELTPSGCTRYAGGYSQFRAQRALGIRTQQARYEKQEREREKLLEAIAMYRMWYDKAHNAAGERNPFLKKRAMKNATRFQAKERALERLSEDAVLRPQDTPQARIEFHSSMFAARTLAEAREIEVAFERNVVLRRVSLTVRRGDRIAILGPNGCGKSTLLRALTAQLPVARGVVHHHPTLCVGYFDQELQRLNQDQTVLDSVLGLPAMTQTQARTILAGFLFGPDDVFKQIGQLSMGERCRLAFVQLYFSQANLLVLDEPTNYLDVDTRERVEEALLEYPGALVLVSHDRYLVAKVANRLGQIVRGRLTVFDGSFDDYLTAQAQTLPTDRSVENEIRQLELSLAQWMGAETPADAVEQANLLQRIRSARQTLDHLRAQQESDRR